MDKNIFVFEVALLISISGYFSRGGVNFAKTAFLKDFLKFNFDFTKKFFRYDQIIYRGVEEYLGEHFLIYRMFIDLFNMSARGGVKFFWVQKNDQKQV